MLCLGFEPAGWKDGRHTQIHWAMLYSVNVAKLVFLPPHIPLIGQVGGILLLRYSIIWILYHSWLFQCLWAQSGLTSWYLNWWHDNNECSPKTRYRTQPAELEKAATVPLPKGKTTYYSKKKSFWILCFIAWANAPWSWLKYLWFNLTLTMIIRGGAIAQWIRLHLPSCDPGFESQSHNLCYYIVKFCAIFVLRKGRK